MSFADPIGDMITRIRNAQLRALYSVKIPSSKFRARILDVLKGEGFISDYELLSDKQNKNKGSLIVGLKYSKGFPVIKEIRVRSKGMWGLKDCKDFVEKVVHDHNLDFSSIDHDTIYPE